MGFVDELKQGIEHIKYLGKKVPESDISVYAIVDSREARYSGRLGLYVSGNVALSRSSDNITDIVFVAKGENEEQYLLDTGKKIDLSLDTSEELGVSSREALLEAGFNVPNKCNLERLKMSSYDVPADPDDEDYDDKHFVTLGNEKISILGTFHHDFDIKHKMSIHKWIEVQNHCRGLQGRFNKRAKKESERTLD